MVRVLDKLSNMIQVIACIILCICVIPLVFICDVYQMVKSYVRKGN